MGCTPASVSEPRGRSVTPSLTAPTQRCHLPQGNPQEANTAFPQDLIQAELPAAVPGAALEGGTCSRTHPGFRPLNSRHKRSGRDTAATIHGLPGGLAARPRVLLLVLVAQVTGRWVAFKELTGHSCKTSPGTASVGARLSLRG